MITSQTCEIKFKVVFVGTATQKVILPPHIPRIGQGGWILLLCFSMICVAAFKWEGWDRTDLLIGNLKRNFQVKWRHSNEVTQITNYKSRLYSQELSKLFQSRLIRSNNILIIFLSSKFLLDCTCGRCYRVVTTVSKATLYDVFFVIKYDPRVLLYQPSCFMAPSCLIYCAI